MVLRDTGYNVWVDVFWFSANRDSQDFLVVIGAARTATNQDCSNEAYRYPGNHSINHSREIDGLHSLGQEFGLSERRTDLQLGQAKVNDTRVWIDLFQP